MLATGSRYEVISRDGRLGHRTASFSVAIGAHVQGYLSGGNLMEPETQIWSYVVFADPTDEHFARAFPGHRKFNMAMDLTPSRLNSMDPELKRKFSDLFEF